MYSEKHSDIKNNLEKMSELANTIGVPIKEILEYIDHLDFKEETAEARKKVYSDYKSTLARLYKAELLKRLNEFGVKINKEQNRNADLIVALAKELEKRNIPIEKFMEYYNGNSDDEG